MGSAIVLGFGLCIGVALALFVLRWIWPVILILTAIVMVMAYFLLVPVLALTGFVLLSYWDTGASLVDSVVKIGLYGPATSRNPRATGAARHGSDGLEPRGTADIRPRTRYFLL